MNLSKITRALFGVPAFTFGMAIIVAEMLRFYQKNVDVHAMHLLLGFVLMYIGGFILNSAMAEAIADNLIEKIDPILNRLPGGRRKTDPPPEEEVTPPHAGE